ncbi:MAG: hypothetical protein Q7T20_00350 [Saprospiraceae bacterium]|nr:hypothetical protein [Saprospiraceae bacterium]
MGKRGDISDAGGGVTSFIEMSGATTRVAPTCSAQIVPWYNRSDFSFNLGDILRMLCFGSLRAALMAAPHGGRPAAGAKAATRWRKGCALCPLLEPVLPAIPNQLSAAPGTQALLPIPSHMINRWILPSIQTLSLLTCSYLCLPYQPARARAQQQ